MPNGKKKKGHKMATHKRKKRLRNAMPSCTISTWAANSILTANI